MDMLIVFWCEPFPYTFVTFAGLFVLYERPSSERIGCNNSQQTEQTSERRIRVLTIWTCQYRILHMVPRISNARKLIQRMNIYVAPVTIFIFHLFGMKRLRAAAGSHKRIPVIVYQNSISNCSLGDIEYLPTNMNHLQKHSGHRRNFVASYEGSNAKQIWTFRAQSLLGVCRSSTIAAVFAINALSKQALKQAAISKEEYYNPCSGSNRRNVSIVLCTIS